MINCPNLYYFSDLHKPKKCYNFVNLILRKILDV